MSKLRVQCFGLSLDGYGAGPDQSRDNPLGVVGPGLFGWFFPTRTFHKMTGKDGGTTGVDDDFATRGFANVGAWILGRNMFGPVCGPWPDESWKGWWGDTPPYHVPVFVLTHHARAPIEMKGGTTFHFVTDGIEAALKRATRRRRRQGRAGRRRRGDDPAVSARGAHRRAAPGAFAGPARNGGASPRGHRHAEARLPMHGACGDGEGVARRAEAAPVTGHLRTFARSRLSAFCQLDFDT